MTPTPEPSHDPTDAILDAIDAGRSVTTIRPLELLAALAEDGTLTSDERDAGEMFHRLAKIALRPKPGKHNIVWRSAGGTWLPHSLTWQEAADVLRKAQRAVATNARLQALNLALAADEPSCTSPNNLMGALSDVVRHWFGGAVRIAAASNGVSIAANDNSPTDERRAIAANDNTRTEEGAWQMKDWPLARMHSRGQLDDDNETSELLYLAGMRYAQDAHLAGMSGSVASPDYARPIVDGGNGPDAFSERRMVRVQSLERARAALGKRYARVADAVLIDERSVTEIRHQVTAHVNKTAASAVTMEMLVAGLRILVRHYGLSIAAAA